MKINKFKNYSFIIALIATIYGCADNLPDFVTQGCTDTNALNYDKNAMINDNSCFFNIELTQSDIDNSSYPLELSQTGQIYDVSNAHNGMPGQTNTDTFRSTYTNLNSFYGDIAPGSVFVKRVFQNNNDEKGMLQAFFGMVKREPGYWPEGGDFEYWMMPFDPTKIDTISMPNGMLPMQVDDLMRGRIPMCASCHSSESSDGDFIFSFGISSALKINQSDINLANIAIDLFKTGQVFEASIAHNGMPGQTNTDTFRSTYTNLENNTMPIVPGTIFTKRVYQNNNGEVGMLQAFFGMVKRKEGYWPEGGDYEYWMMPYNPATIDTLNMSNGMFPMQTDDMMRGKIPMCASCHSSDSSGGNFIFSY